VILLVPHPRTPGRAVRGVRAAAARTPQGTLALRYRIEADLERLRIPPPCAPAPGERLWQHLCCEVFVAPAGAGAGAGSGAGSGADSGAGSYREFNFSPSGEWSAYAFQGYREGGPLAVPDPGIAVRTDGQALELSAAVEVEAAKLRVALCVVIEDLDGALSYWALRHPAPRPDFHHADGFALEIA
jgi:hypothetical protein